MKTSRSLQFTMLFLLALPFQTLHAEGPAWKHLSTRNGDLPVPGKSTQQTAALVADLDQSGRNGFVLGFRFCAPALVWYRPTAKGWDRLVIEPEFLTIEAGGAVCDIDEDGWPDLVFGGDWQSNCVWWWRNPGKDWKPDVRWERHTIKRSGKTQHHDQCAADFKGIGKPQLAYWNQGASTLFVAEIPSSPRQVEEWPAQRVFSGSAGESPGKYAEGMSSVDIDGDGKPEILAGNHMFSWGKDDSWHATKIGDIGGLIFAGRFIKDSKIPQVVIAPGDGSGPVKWYACRGNPHETKNWLGHDLVGRPMIHPHSLQVGDIDGDGNLDIFVAEMAKWTESRNEPDNPKAQAFICYGDGKGRFKKTVFQTGMGFHEARVADLNGDGRLDILSKPYNWEAPRLDIWLNEGTDRSTASTASTGTSTRWDLMLLDPDPPGAGETGSTAVGDIDGDGRQEVIAGRSVAGSNPERWALYWYGPGKDLRQPFVEHPIDPVIDIHGGGPHDVLVADLDGDGKPEIVAGEHDPFNPYKSRCRLFVYKLADPQGTVWFRYPLDDRFEQHDGAKVVELAPGMLGLIGHGWAENRYVHLWRPR